jgi:hypothetical protein
MTVSFSVLSRPKLRNRETSAERMMTLPATAIARTASALVSFLLRFDLLPERLFFLSPGLAGNFGISTEFIGRKTPDKEQVPGAIPRPLNLKPLS